MSCSFKTTDSGLPQRCMLTVGAHNEWCGNDHIILSSTKPIRAVTPGNYVAYYKGEECIGSARILRTGPSMYAMNYHQYADLRREGTDNKSSMLKSFFSKINWS